VVVAGSMRDGAASAMRVAASTPGMKAERGAKLPSSTAAPPTDYAARDDKSALSESAARQQVRACTSTFFFSSGRG
jgi:hypothetical protein